MYMIAASTQPGNCTNGELRLDGGGSDDGARSGRLELCLNNAWGVICNSSFGVVDAQLACNQLTGFHMEGKCILSDRPDLHDRT